MSARKLEVEKVIQKRRLLEEQMFSVRTEEDVPQTHRRNVVRVINSNVPPELLKSYSTKVVVKRLQKSKSPLAELKKQKTKPTVDNPRQKRKSVICNPAEQNDSARNAKYFSTRKNSIKTGSLSAQIHEEIHKIKSLSKLIADLKFPSALPSKTRKMRKLQGLEDRNPQEKPLISVIIERENGFIRPVMHVREQEQKLFTEQKQFTEKKLRSLFKSKQKLKTAPATIEFVLHIRSHQEVFQQESKVKQTKNEVVKRFRSSCRKKPSKPHKASQVQVSPWLVTQPLHFD